ncbi:MAG: hypothetical protein QOI90_3063, partial [Mycobacterium sp.]|nr:hypothetical protein [Mycobacterium sp.]
PIPGSLALPTADEADDVATLTKA